MHLDGNVKNDKLPNLIWREKGQVSVTLEATTGNYRARVGGADIGSWASEKDARRAAKKFKKQGIV